MDTKFTVNWKAIGFGFIVTLVLAYLGNYVPYLDIPIAPFKVESSPVMWWEEVTKMELLMVDFQQV
jgi:hypothetical protein